MSFSVTASFKTPIWPQLQLFSEQRYIVFFFFLISDSTNSRFLNSLFDSLTLYVFIYFRVFLKTKH